MRPTLHTLVSLFGVVMFSASVQAASIEMTTNPETTLPNESFVVEIVVSNETGTTESGLTVELVYPANLNLIGESFISGPVDSSSCNTAGSLVQCTPGETIIWNLGSLGAGDVRHMSFSSSSISTTPNNTTINFQADLIQSSSTIESATSSVLVETTASLSLGLSENQDPVVAGSQLIYALSWGNITTGNINNTSLALTLPAGTTFVSATDGGSHAAGVVSWGLSTLFGSQNDTFEVTVSVNGGLANGTLLAASAEITGDGGVAEQATTVTHVQSNVPLTMAMSLHPNPQDDNTTSIVEIVVSNSGSVTQSGVTMQMRWPAGINPLTESFVSGAFDAANSCAQAGSTVQCTAAELLAWNFGNLAPGQTEVTTFPVVVPNGTVDANLRRFAPLLFAAGQTIEESATIVVNESQLTLDLSENQDPVVAGSQLTYALSWGNITTGNINNSSLALTLPAGTTFVSATDGGSHSAGVVSWNLNTLFGSQIDTFEVIVSVNGGLANGTLLQASAEITGDVGVADTAAEQATTITHVQSNVPLTMALSLHPNPQDDNTTSIVEIVVSNPGSVIQSGVTMQMRWPAGINPLTESFIVGAFDAASSCAQTGSTVQCTATELLEWNFGNLAPGQTEVTTFPVVVPNGTVDANLRRFAPLLFAAGQTIEESATIVVKESQLTLDLSENQDPVVAGSQLTYALSWGNITMGNIDNTNLALTLPAGTSFVSATDGGSHSAGVVSWNLNTLFGSQIDTFEVIVSVNGGLANGTLLQASAEITGDIGIPDAAAEKATTITHVQSNVPLTMAVSVNPNPQDDNTTSIVEIVVSNPGSVIQSGVTMQMRWPAGINLLAESFIVGAFDAASSCAQTGSTVQCTATELLEWNFGNLAPGQTEVTTFPVVVPNGTADANLRRFAPLLFAAGQTIEESATMIVKTPDLSLALDVLEFAGSDINQIPISPGEKLTYGLKYGNVTGVNVNDTELLFRLPEGTTFEYATGNGVHSGDTVTWDLQTLIADDIGEQKVKVRVAPSASDGTLVEARASIEGADSHARTAQRIVFVDDVHPLTLDLTLSPFPNTSAEQISLTLSVTNVSGGPVSGAVIEMRYPTGFQLITEAVIPGLDAVLSCNQAGSTVQCTSGETLIWTLPTLSALETISFTFNPVLASLPNASIVSVRASVGEASNALAVATGSTIIAAARTDSDNDGVGDNFENCLNTPNADQRDNDLDGLGDVCDADDDNDGLSDVDELAANPFVTDPFDPDTDGDDIIDGLDRDPLSAANNLCFGLGDDAIFSSNVSGMVTCAAANSITVIFPGSVDVSGDLLLISPAVIVEEITVKVDGKLTVISKNPTATVP